MQLQAPLHSGRTASKSMQTKRSFATRDASVLAAASLAALLAVTTGCGNGVISASAPQQNITTPQASAKGPQLGYIWGTSDKTLRPILGVSGASQIGQSVVPAGVYAGAATSAIASIAVLQDNDGAFDLMTLPSGSPASLGLTLPTGARIRLSPAATTALIYTPGATSASLVIGLLSTPAVHTLTAPGPISDSAVSDTGSASFAYAQGSSFAIAAVALDGRAVPVATVKSIGGLNFLPGKDDLLFADATANSLTLMRSITSAPSTSLIQTSQLLKSPSAVGISGSGRWALVSNSGNQSLVRVDLTTLTSTAVSCSCTPTLASTLADDGAFRVTDAASGPNWIVDAASATPRTLFIPALPSAAKTSLIASVAP